MVEFLIEVEGDDPDFGGAANRLERWANTLETQLEAFMERLAEQILAELKYWTPVYHGYNPPKEPPGTTRESWTVIWEGQDGFFITNSNEPVITYLTIGTAAHDVYPVWARVLHWIDEAGQHHFAMHTHPKGIIGFDIEEAVMREFDPIIEAGLDACIDAADREGGFE
jgi:hypothetical protein